MPVAVPIASGLVPEAIVVFLERSRTEWTQVSTGRAAGSRAYRSPFTDNDPRLNFFDAVDAPIAAPEEDIQAEDDPTADADLGPHAPMTLTRTVPKPTRVVPMPRPPEEARTGAPARRGPSRDVRGLARAAVRPLTRAAAVGVIVGTVVLLGQGVRPSAPEEETRLRASRPPSAPEALGPLARLQGLARGLWGPAAPPSTTEVTTPSGEMVATTPGHGVLELVVEGDADVWIDGSPRGVVQASGLFTLPAGQHEIELRVNGVRALRTVDVGDQQAVVVELPPAAGD